MTPTGYTSRVPSAPLDVREQKPDTPLSRELVMGFSNILWENRLTVPLFK